MKRFTYRLLALLWLLPLLAQADSPWVKLDGCTYADNPYNDGDSFHVRQQGREYIFRLYFVDTPETDDGFADRVRDQADYFGVSVPAVVQIGQDAAKFVRQNLSNKTFTVVTRWQGAQGRSKLPRFYAFVRVNGRDLAEWLVSEGLARVYGVRATTPEGVAPDTARAKLFALEDAARHARFGAWTTSRQLNVAEAREEAMRTDSVVIMPPRTINTYTTEMPRQKLGSITRDTHVHVLEEYADGWVRVAYDTGGQDEEAVCLRWELGLPDLPSAPSALRAGTPVAPALP